MKDFVEKYPQFRQLQTNAVKHMTVAGELHKLIDKRNLLQVTEMEQELASVDNHAVAVQKVVCFYRSPV
jgi:vacuolar protein sorting-associated protein 45